MTLNSLDIQNKTFNLQFRGYHKQEVDEFLQIVVNDYDEMMQKIKDQDRELKTLQERLRDFDNMKDTLNKSLIVAQDAADNLKSQAEREAEHITREAQSHTDEMMNAAQREARQVLQDTYDEARRLVNESDELKRGMRSYYQRITMLIEGQLASIKSAEWEEALKPNPIYVGDTEDKLREIIEHTNRAFQPINEQGQVIESREGTAPETFESFEKALQGEPVLSPASNQSEPNDEAAHQAQESDKNNGSVNLGAQVNFGQE